MTPYLISMVISSLVQLHPIHVSVTEIDYDQQRKALEITSHIFIDDLENEIRKNLKEPFLDVTNPSKDRTTDELIINYLKKRFKIMVNGKETPYNYLGHEVEAGAIYLYLEIEKVKKLNDISVYNSVLLDFFDDQVNLVHVKINGKIRSMKITPENRQDKLIFNK